VPGRGETLSSSSAAAASVTAAVTGAVAASVTTAVAAARIVRLQPAPWLHSFWVVSKGQHS
jgi:hypothetical protein